MSTPPPLPGTLGTLAPLLDHYGYLAVAGLITLEDFGVPVPGETVLIPAAVYAGAGRLNIIAVALILWALILGFALSAVVQALVPKSTIVRLLGDDRPRAPRDSRRAGSGVLVVLLRGGSVGAVVVP
jgi:hypothetical protein